MKLCQIQLLYLHQLEQLYDADIFAPCWIT